MSCKTYELDKVCRICLVEKKDMRPLFGELVADMLMEIARVEIENTDGWPDKICVQCVHQVSRCHAFKMRVEKSDEELRKYIKSLTVYVEEFNDILNKNNSQSSLSVNSIKHLTESVCHLSTNTLSSNTHQPLHKLTNAPQTNIPTSICDESALDSHSEDITNSVNSTLSNAIHSINFSRSLDLCSSSLREINVSTITPQMVLSNENGQDTQIINQLCNQPLTQIVNASQLSQLIQSGNTVQVFQNGQTQLLQIQRDEERCEIIVQSDFPEDSEYFEDVVDLDPDELNEDSEKNVIQLSEDVDEIELDSEDVANLSHEELTFELDPENSDTEIENELENDSNANGDFKYEKEEEEETDPQYIAEFINSQITCLGTGRYACNLCRREFKQIKWLHTHMKSHSNWIKANCKKQPQCQICGRSFQGPGMLKMHMKTHQTIEKIPKCSICEKTFKSKTILYRHRQTHQQKSYQCGNCLKHFSSPYTLTSHMLKKHSDENPKFQCSLCDEFFDTIEILKCHMQQTGHSIHIIKDNFFK